MPLAETNGGRRTWGYDGVLPYAPQQFIRVAGAISSAFVDAAHERSG